MGTFIFIVVAASIVAIAVGIGMMWEKQRREGMQRLAGDLGIEYRMRLEAPDDELFSKFSLSQRGRDRVASNVLVADSGDLRMVIFDYKYTVGSGKHKSTPKQTVVLARSAQLSMPQFELSPEGIFQKIANLFGYQDINFEDDTAFSSAFKLQGPEVDRIRSFFTAKRRQSLVAQPKVNLDANGQHFIFYQARRQKSIADVKGLMEQAFAIYSVMREEETAVN